MRFTGFFSVVVLVLAVGILLATERPVQAGVSNKASSVSSYYKSKVKGIILQKNQKLSGQIVAFRKNGIIFRRLKEGPLYTPKPEYIPMHHIQAFIDENGRPLWGTIPPTKKYDFLKIRNYHLKWAVQYGMGQNTYSCTFSPLIANMENYIQTLHSGGTLSTQLTYFVSPHFGIGVKYIHHNTKADIYSLTTASNSFITDDITIQNYLFDVGFYRSISRMIIFTTDVAIGALFYKNSRQSSTGGVEIAGTSFCTILSGGVDFMATRAIGFGFELSYLFGTVKEPNIRGSAVLIDGSQKLNRFDINAGMRFYF
ncbi:hypothetical protein EH223_15450 [candidate division KSB1 bacterium]|nr:hypothetical protein [candidate division KSB1 bacterium]RQW01311.1 MAG: hypothetical protein EH223_15450 [candidate division KSB1 bacterium]